MRKAEQWPAIRGRLKKYLEPSDKIYFRKVTDNGTPESVGGGNAGKSCIAILGVKEIEGLQKIGEFRGREEYQGLSVDILQDDIVFSCVVDSRGYPASLGLPNVGKDVTIIVHGTEEETQKAADKAFDEKLKVIDDDLDRIQTEMNKIQAEQDELLKDFRGMKKHG